jgi:hypothetical protein
MRSLLTFCTAFAGAIMLLAALLGCALGAIAYKLTPEPKLPAEFPLQPVPTLILADDAQDRSLGSIDADRLARLVEQQFVSWQIAPVIPQDRVVALRDADPTGFNRRSVTSIARELGAQQVISITFEGVEIGVSLGTDMPRARAAARVRVVNDQGQIVFPIDNQAGRGMMFQTPHRRGDERSTARTAQGLALDGLARNIARLFRPYVASELDQQTFD